MGAPFACLAALLCIIVLSLLLIRDLFRGHHLFMVIPHRGPPGLQEPLRVDLVFGLCLGTVLALHALVGLSLGTSRLVDRFERASFKIGLL